MINNKLISDILSLIIILFFSLIFFLTIQSNREITHEPDDQYHILIKSSNYDHCLNNDCFEKNITKFGKQDDKFSQFMLERQIKRLILSYNPLYSYSLNKFSSFLDVSRFKSEMIFRSLMSILLSFIVFFSFKNYFDKKYLVLISLVFATHYNFVSGYQFLRPSEFATILAFFSFLIFEKHRYFSLVIFLLSILIHKGAMLIFGISYLTFFIKFFFENRHKERNYLKIIKNFLYIEYRYLILSLIIVLAGFYAEFTPFKNNFNVLNVYSYPDIFDAIKNNFNYFFTKFYKSIIILNPILFYFFLKAYLKKDKTDNLKIFILIYFIISLIFINATIPNKLARMSWSIFILSYLIISFFNLEKISQKDKFGFFLKKIFLITLPLFIFLNIYKLSQSVDLKILKENLNYDYKNVQLYLNKKIDNNDFIFFDTLEGTFYYYLNSGFIKKNFLFSKLNPIDEVKKKVKYVIIDNPIINQNRNSDILINNNSKLKFLDYKNPLQIVIKAKNDSTTFINKKKVKLKKGLNKININSENVIFKKPSEQLRLSGIILNNQQKTSWPWSENFKFIYEYGDQRRFRYKINNEYIREYDFKNLKSSIDTKINFKKCGYNILSDIDSTIISKINC